MSRGPDFGKTSLHAAFPGTRTDGGAMNQWAEQDSLLGRDARGRRILGDYEMG